MNLQLELEMDSLVKISQINAAERGKQIIFVGFKDAVEVISEVWFWIDGRLVDNYHQNEMIRESFAYNCIRPKDAKKANPHSHSLYEDVINMSPNVCGVYIPLEKFYNDSKIPQVTVEMQLVIPFTDQLALQAWRLYPNCVFGKMEEEIKLAVDALVWCQIPPKNVAEIKSFWDPDSMKNVNAPDVPISNHFIQINQTGAIVTHVSVQQTDVTTAQTKPAEFSCIVSNIGTAAKIDLITYQVGLNKLKVNKTQCKALRIKMNCAGFGVKPEVANQLTQLFAQPLIIPAQELTRHQFENSPTDSGFSISKNVPLKNATNITMMFPTHSEDCTVFKNIMYDNVKLIINKRNYPETEFLNTWDGRFVQYQLMTNELDGYIEPTREFVESIARPLNHVVFGETTATSTDVLKTSGDPEKYARYLSCPFDNTSFGINFQLERGGAGYVFDGIDTGSHTVCIELRGTSNSRKPDLKDTSKDSDAAKFQVDTATKNTCPPEMWICSDTYWVWDAATGVTYYPNGIPAGYE